VIPTSGVPSEEDTKNTAPQAQISLLSPGPRLLLWILIILGILGSVTSAIIAFIRWNFAFSHYGPAVVWKWSAPAVIAGLISSMVWVTALILWIARRSHLALILPEGLVLQRGSRRIHYPWQQLRDLKLYVVQYGLAFIQWGERAVVSLMTLQGKRIRFSGPRDDLEDFTNVIKHYLYPRRLAEYRAALEARQIISFGPLQCSQDGLLYRKKRYPWDQLNSAKLDGGRLILSIKDGDKIEKIRIAARNIPNPDLCAQLITSIEY
jgi:hypothetical protein